MIPYVMRRVVSNGRCSTGALRGASLVRQISSVVSAAPRTRAHTSLQWTVVPGTSWRCHTIDSPATDTVSYAVSASEFEANLADCGVRMTGCMVPAVAVSGGPDSMALCALVRELVRQSNGAQVPPLLVFVVDHGLRDESAAEAASVVAALQRWGDCVPKLLTVAWDEHGGKPKAAQMQSMARQARYATLHTACQKHRVSHLFVGHHAGDQMETSLLRFGRASGIAGLPGMHSVAPLRTQASDAPVHIVRPLLNFSKARLEATCAAHGIEPVRDPSNTDTTYDRARARLAIASIYDGREHVLGSLERSLSFLDVVRGDMQAATQDLLRQCVKADGEMQQFGIAAVHVRALLAEPRSSVQEQALSDIVACYGGRSVPPRMSGLRRLSTTLSSQLTGPGAVAGTGGAVFIPVHSRVTRQLAASLGVADANEDWAIVCRELRQLQTPDQLEDAADGDLDGVELSSEAPVHWDQRFVVSMDARAAVVPQLVVRPPCSANIPQSMCAIPRRV